MSELEYRWAWHHRNPDVVHDVEAFWRSLDILPSEAIPARTDELIAVAYSDGKVVAVSTGTIYDSAQLRARFVYYRTMVSPEHRKAKLASHLCSYSRKRLTQWARENPEEKLKGLFIALQSIDLFRNRLHFPIIEQLDMKLILVGYTPNGTQLRVVWFEDAAVE